MGKEWSYNTDYNKLGKQMKMKLDAVFNHTTQKHAVETNKNFPKVSSYFVKAWNSKDDGPIRLAYLEKEAAELDNDVCAQLIGVPREFRQHFFEKFGERRLKMSQNRLKCDNEHENCFDPKCWFFTYDETKKTNRKRCIENSTDAPAVKSKKIKKNNLKFY